MTIDFTQLVIINDAQNYGLCLAEPTNAGVKLIGRYYTYCKAYLWDDMYKLFKQFYNPSQCCVVYTRPKNDCYDVTPTFSAERIKLIQDRFSPLEKALGFKTTKLTLVPEHDSLVAQGSVRWLSHLVLFSLFLSILRYNNYNDQFGYDLSLKRLNELTEWYNKTCKGKKLHEGWLPEWESYTHTLGIVDFWKNGKKITA